ncbi:MAG: ABC transporter permease, partial [Legionella sp.]
MRLSTPKIMFLKKQAQYKCVGAWNVLKLNHLVKEFKETDLPSSQKIIINGKAIKEFDSAGALALNHCIKALKERKNEVELVEFSEPELQLLELIESKRESLDYQIPEPHKENIFYHIGKEAENKLMQVDGLIILIGDLSTKFFDALGHWRRFQIPSIISNVDSAGLKALPIIALLSFLIGVVLAYQMGLQLETYGANIFIAYLSGMAIFREFAPLITAIIVAGRTSSAFTA